MLMRTRLAALRPWLAVVAAVAVVGVLAPPAGTAAGRYAFAQAIQFAVLAIVAPALLVLGAPWRLLPAGSQAARLAGRIATARSHRPGTARAWACLGAFIAVAIAWRLPVAVNLLVRHPPLNAVQAVTLIVAGCALWLELADSPPLLPGISRPLRAAFAALPMWSTWAAAYIMGFSRGTWFAAFAHQPGQGLTTVADQQIAAAILWAIPAACFAPVVFVAWITWLGDSSDPDAELGEVQAAGRPARPRPPRGWRMPPA